MKPSTANPADRIIIMPPAVYAIAALVGRDHQEEDGIPAGKYQLGGVHVKQDGDTITCEATNGRIAGRYTSKIAQIQPIEEPRRYPDLDAVIPKTPPIAAIVFDPEMLIGLLRACQAVAGWSGTVTMEIHGNTQPFVLRATNNVRGRDFVGVQMPLKPMAAREE